MGAGGQGVIHAAFDGGVGIGPPKGAPHAFVVRFHGDFRVKLGNAWATRRKNPGGAASKSSYEYRLLVAGDGIQEALGVGIAVLADVAEE